MIKSVMPSSSLNNNSQSFNNDKRRKQKKQELVEIDNFPNEEQIKVIDKQAMFEYQLNLVNKIKNLGDIRAEAYLKWELVQGFLVDIKVPDDVIIRWPAPPKNIVDIIV